MRIVPAKARLARLPRLAVVMVLAFGPAGPPPSISRGTSGCAAWAGGGFDRCAGAASALVAATLATIPAQSIHLCNVWAPMRSERFAGRVARCQASWAMARAVATLCPASFVGRLGAEVLGVRLKARSRRVEWENRDENRINCHGSDRCVCVRRSRAEPPLARIRRRCQAQCAPCLFVGRLNCTLIRQFARHAASS